jgi:DNA-binding SARP family transcriptional activator/TolB-like protein/Tfp pilus assembly protein PilF
MIPVSTSGAERITDAHESRAPPRLAITVFGGIGISYNRSEVRLTRRKARALLAYLALSETGRETRERLAGLLWPETSEQNARASLRQVLAEIRESLISCGCHALLAGRHDIELISDAIDVDSLSILREIAVGRVPEVLLIQPRMGETLLFGYDDLSPLFREWILATRAHLQERLVRALEQCYENEDLPRRQRRLLADAVLMLEPLHEAACRTVMRLAAEDGEIGTALRAYADLYRALDEDLDMEPSGPTRELVAEIKQGRFDREVEPIRHPSRPEIGAYDPGQRASSGIPVVAVLPFRAIGPDQVPSYFAEGVLEDTVRTLAMLREPVVISSNSTREFRGPDIDLREVAQRVGAQYVVSGTVRVVGTRVRLSAELVEVSGGTVLWSRAYDAFEPLEFETQDDIAGNIARTLVPHLRNEELRRSRGHQPEDLNAYRLMLQARELIFTLERPAFERAGTLLQDALKLDPGYAPIHTAVANWYSLRIGQGWAPKPESDERALETTARKAIALDSANGRALAMLAHNRTIHRREYDEAVSLLDRAIEASPNDAEVLMWSGPTYAYIGEPTEALHRLERAISLSPEDPFMFRYEHFMSIAHYSAANYEDAAHWGTRSLRRNPHYTSNLRMTAASLAAAGRPSDARPLVRRAMELQPGFRVLPMIEKQAFRSDDQRERYAEHLTEAGLPL